MKKNKTWVVGLTGKNASGKGEIGRYLVSLGYQYRSLSDVVRDEVRKRGLDASRENLIRIANDLRAHHGAATLADEAASTLAEGLHVIDSIRNPAEVDRLRLAGKFLLLGVDADPKVRFARAMKRGRTENAATIEEFIAIENRERTSDPLAQQLDQCLKIADEVVRNDSTLAALEEEVRTVLTRRGFPSRTR